MKMNLRLCFGLCLFLSISVFTYCTPVSTDGLTVKEGQGSFSKKTLPIMNGSAPTQPYHDAVVSLHRVYNGSVYVSPFCTGTLISKDVILTAAHCLDTASQKRKQFQTMAPSALAIYVGNEPSVDILSHIYLVKETLIYPRYDRNRLLNDIALIRLQKAVVEPVTPVPHLPASLGFTSADIGSSINFAGFGKTETNSSGVKLQVNGTLTAFGCTVRGCTSSGDSATQISYTQEVSGPCSGDSGGPAFFNRNGVTYVAGITSYGDSYCTIYGVSTRTDAFDSWIKAFVSPVVGPDCSSNGVCNSECSEGEDPDCNVEPPPPSSCGNGVCDEGESCDGRSGTAACAKDCPGSQKGKPSSRYCYVGSTCTGAGCP